MGSTLPPPLLTIYGVSIQSELDPVTLGAAVVPLVGLVIAGRQLRNVLTNAGLEGVNAVIQWVKKTARGLRNAEHFKTAIKLPPWRPRSLPTRKPVEPNQVIY